MARAKPTGWMIAAAALALTFVTLGVRTLDAHKAVTSKYDYNKDVFPLLRDHCGQCHLEGGPAPMSLMTYKDAVPWAEAIRDELTTGRMPPFPVDPRSPAVKGMPSITSHDVDVIVTWAAGGTPHDWADQAHPNKVMPKVTLDRQWKLGPPDATLTMDAEHTVAAGTIEDAADVSIPAGNADVKWIRGVDLMPGAVRMVRDAVISIENGPTIGLWQPGGDAVAAPSGAAFRLAPNAKIHLQIHYKKHYDQEADAIKDKSSVGLYFTDPPASGRELQSMAIDQAQPGGESGGVQIFKKTLSGAARIVAVTPMLDKAYDTIDVVATTPTGKQISLVRLRGPRPQWFRRYWLQEATELASGSTLEVRVTPLADYSDEMKSAQNRFPLQIAVDYVPQ